MVKKILIPAFRFFMAVLELIGTFGSVTAVAAAIAFVLWFIVSAIGSPMRGGALAIVVHILILLLILVVMSFLFIKGLAMAAAFGWPKTRFKRAALLSLLLALGCLILGLYDREVFSLTAAFSVGYAVAAVLFWRRVPLRLLGIKEEKEP